MISYKYIVFDRQELHATSAMNLDGAATEYESRVTPIGTKGTMDCRNILALMSLGAGQGGGLEPTMEGPDEGQASGLLKGLMHVVL